MNEDELQALIREVGGTPRDLELLRIYFSGSPLHVSSVRGVHDEESLRLALETVNETFKGTATRPSYEIFALLVPVVIREENAPLNTTIPPDGKTLATPLLGAIRAQLHIATASVRSSVTPRDAPKFFNAVLKRLEDPTRRDVVHRLILSAVPLDGQTMKNV